MHYAVRQMGMPFGEQYRATQTGIDVHPKFVL